MAKINIPPITAQFASAEALNNRFQQIEEALNELVLYRDNPDSEPNQMANELDMDFNPIINLPAPGSPNSPVRLRDVVEGLVTEFVEVNTTTTEEARDNVIYWITGLGARVVNLEELTDLQSVLIINHGEEVGVQLVELPSGTTGLGMSTIQEIASPVMLTQGVTVFFRAGNRIFISGR